MHMVIRVIVYAKNSNEALGRATNILERLCEQGSFDYFSTFDEDGSKLPAVCRADSKAGKKLIEEGMRATKKELFENLRRVRNGLKALTDEEIWEGKNKSREAEAPLEYDSRMLRHFMYDVGKYSGSSYWLYDNDGSAIRDSEHLKDVLNKWACIYEDKGEENPHEKLDIFVVPAHVHY